MQIAGFVCTAWIDQSFLKTKGPNLLRKRETDRYAQLIAEENFNNLFAAKSQPARDNLDDPSARNRLLKLARAILQQPVDFTQQQLYPLDRLKSVPDYTGTPADASGGK